MKVHSAELFTSCASPRDFPQPELPEVVFLGRSNVGKSSLLNRLVHRKNLARTSSTPGKTRLIHFFRVELGSRELLLADLPGYGFAKVSRSESRGWQRLVESYLEGRPTLRAAILLQDLRRDVSDDETLLLDWLAEREVFAFVALTKSDKLKPMRRAKRIRELEMQLADARVPVVATSAQTGLGIDALWRTVFERL